MPLVPTKSQDVSPARDLLPRLQPGPLSWQLTFLPVASSTNDIARHLGQAGAAAGQVIVADTQTAGRGQRGRAWHSAPRAGLWVSLLLRPELAPAELGRLMQLASVAALDAVRGVAQVRPGLKWPNDLILAERKLGGILIETELRRGRLAYAIVGLGVNLQQETRDFPPHLQASAISLRGATGRSISRDDLLVAFLNAWNRHSAQSSSTWFRVWRAASVTLGRTVQVTGPNGPVTGYARRLTRSGALILKLPDGQSLEVTSGSPGV